MGDKGRRGKWWWESGGVVVGNVHKPSPRFACTMQTAPPPPPQVGEGPNESANFGEVAKNQNFGCSIILPGFQGSSGEWVWAAYGYPVDFRPSHHW